MTASEVAQGPAGAQASAAAAEPGVAGRIEWWAGWLRGAERLSLPTDPDGAGRPLDGCGVVARILPADVRCVLRRRATELAVTEPDVVLAIFAAWLHRHSGQRDLLVGVRVPDAGEPQAVQPLRVEVDDVMTLAELAATCRQSMLEAQAHGAPLADTWAAADGTEARLRAVISVPSTAASRGAFGHLGAGVELAVEVALGAAASDQDSHIALSYRTGAADPSVADRLLERFDELLRQALAVPGSPLGRLEMIAPAEAALIAAAGRAAGRPFGDATVPERFAGQARRHPGRTAVVDDRGNEITYAELDQRTSGLARLLVERGVRPETRCAIVLDRGIDAIVAIIATMKAGGAYVPIDPGLPTQRTAAQFADAGVEIVLTHSRLAPGLPGGPQLVTLDTIACEPADGAVAVTLSPGHLAYVMYTSGSTGLPKGVLIDHGALTHFVDMIHEFFQMSQRDRVAHCAALWFDVSVFEIFSALLVGGSVHVASDDTKLTPGALQSMLGDGEITVLMSTPSLLEALDPGDLPCLRVMSIGGEPFSPQLTNRWMPGRRFINGYGPAEATVEVVAKVCTSPAASTPPIGRPLANHRAYVLDERMRMVPIGMVGELYVGGPGLARGYLARPGLTAGAFLPDPLGESPGQRLYRTGDLVRWLPNLDLVYVGRFDRQVKIRGMRAELGEVEHALARCPGVMRAAVAASRDHAGDVRIVGYVVAGDGVTATGIRESVMDWLPPYLVPAEVVVVDSFPTTTSGKIDFAALADLAPPVADQAAAAGDGFTATQQAVGEIVREILAVPRSEEH